MDDFYPVEFIEQTDTHFIYQFETLDKGFFVVRFTRAAYYFNSGCDPCQTICEVNFFPVTKLKNIGKDWRIMATVINLIEVFMTENMCPMLYVCESLDNLQECGLRLFRKWFGTFPGKSNYQHDCIEIEWLDSNIFIGIIAFGWDSNFSIYFNQIGIE